MDDKIKQTQYIVKPARRYLRKGELPITKKSLDEACEKIQKLEEFAKIMASRKLVIPRLQDSIIMFYDVDKRHSETEFNLVKEVMDEYGK